MIVRDKRKSCLLCSFHVQIENLLRKTSSVCLSVPFRCVPNHNLTLLNDRFFVEMIVRDKRKSCTLGNLQAYAYVNTFVNTVGLLPKTYSVCHSLQIDVRTLNFLLHEYPISVPLQYKGFIPLYL
jgi:hypothetical protein